MGDEKFDKQFDLEPTEFRQSTEPQPFWGFNAKPMLILFLASFPVAAVASLIVYGEMPYWLRWMLE